MDTGSVYIVGRLTRDPKVFGEGDKARALFGVAFNRGRGDNRKTTFLDCIAWGRRADLVARMSKGEGITLQGELEMDQWEKDGEKKQRLQVNVNTFTPTANFAEAAPRQSDSDNADEGVSVDIPF